MLTFDDALPQGKWLIGLSPKQSINTVAHRVLKARLYAIQYWLPLAAARCDDDVEYVHQLRVSTRRATEALRLFSELLPETACQELLADIRQLRRAADEARNLDVLTAGLKCSTTAGGSSICERICQAVNQRRQSAQEPINSVEREFLAAGFDRRIKQVVDQLLRRRNDTKQPTLGQQAPRLLKSVVRKFSKASLVDLSDEQEFHRLRICTKRLRYTIEIVESAFKPCLRNKIYNEISNLQDFMGAVNDHATAKSLFANWISDSKDSELLAFLQGVLWSEVRAHEDLHQAFCSIWTPQAFKELRGRLQACCGLTSK